MKRFWGFILTILVTFSFFSLPSISETKEEQNAVYLYCLNIGKADCMILSYQDQHYLIDTGYAHTYPALETALKMLNIDRLNGVFITHCHKDHTGGLMQLAKSNIAIDAIYASDIYYDVKETKHPAVLAARERNMNVSFLKTGDVVSLGGDAVFTVLGPVQTNTENENNNSLVMRFSSPEGSILFAGDMKTEEEYDLLSRNLLEKSDVLKCGHHGDDGATSAALLQAVRPRHALILTSTFEEKDTPATATLARLKSAGCTVHISQNMDDALAVKLEDGQISVYNATWSALPMRTTGLRCSLSRSNDTLTLTNTTDITITLSGCYLYSSRGEDVFSLPDFVIPAKESIVIGSKSTDGYTDITLDKKNVWHDKKRDMAMLYDAFGRLLCQTDNGLKEE